MPFKIVVKDITRIKADAIVNAANTSLVQGGGVCGAIFKVAGQSQLKTACQSLAPVEVSQAVITPAFQLDAKYIIHAVGPIYTKYTPDKAKKLLKSTYENALNLADKNKCKSIAFPLISAGIYGYPIQEAIDIAINTIQAFLIDHEMMITLALLDKNVFQISKDLIADIDLWLDYNYQDPNKNRRLLLKNIDIYEERFAQEVCLYESSLEDKLENLDEPFSTTLLKLIDSKGKSDVEVYKGANIDRKLFSKIRTNKNYTPKKTTILSLAISLKLNMQESELLLKKAGFAFSDANKFDVIIQYFIYNQIYDIYQINEVLFHYDQPLLGS